MFNSVRADDQLELAWEEEVLEIDVLEDGDSRSVAVTPGLNVRGADQEVHIAFSGKPATPRPLPQFDHHYANAEYNRLVRREHEFDRSPEFFDRLASLAKRAGRLLDAVTHAKRAAELSGSSFFKYRLAAALLDVEDEKSAVQLMNALAREEAHIPSSLRLAELRIADNDIDGAVEYVRMALEQDELDWRSNMVAGAVALCQSAFEAAVHYFRVALQDRPNSAILYFNLSLAHYRLRNEVAALKSARRAISLNPFGRKAQLFFADMSIKSKGAKELELAIRYIELFLKVDCDDNIVGRLTQLARESRKQKAVIKVIDHLPQYCVSPSVQNNLGVLYSDIGQKRKAQMLFSKAALAPDGEISSGDRVLAAANLANAMLQNGSYEAVEAMTSELLNNLDIADIVKDENTSRLLAARLKSLYYQERIRAGETLSAEIMNFEGRQPRLDFIVGILKVCYESTVTGNFDDALPYAEIALGAARRLNLNRDISSNVALNNYVYVLLELNRIDDAQNYISSLRTDLNDSEYIFATMGLLKIKSGDLRQGENLYRHSAALAKSKTVKGTMLKKMNYEMAKALVNADPKTALKYAHAAAKIKYAKIQWPARYLDSKVTALIAVLQRKLKAID